MNALSEYQQAVLAQLDIIQWRLRDPDVNAQAQVEPVIESPAVQTLPQDPIQSDVPAQSVEQPVPKVQYVQQDSLFAQDVLLAVQQLQQSTEVTLDWQLGDTIQLRDVGLITPSPEQLQAQPQLKKQLWNILQQWQK